MSTIQKTRETIELDATGIALGRLAAKIAMVLQGKHKPQYVPYLDTGDKVVVTNAGKIKLTGRKLEQKDYKHHTMFPGGLKTKPMKKVFLDNPGKVLEHAIYGMLPKNRTRDELMKRVTFKS
ncbi:MAG: 50S ribosomal protein L13 [Patescibacteria group bacterium]